MYGLGVDLGTSFVAAAVGERGRTRPLRLGPAGLLAPAGTPEANVQLLAAECAAITGEAAARG